METIVPIIVAIAFFVFQAYANFQKEQEKARKRNPGQPRVPTEADAQPFEEYQPMEGPSIPDYWEEPSPQPVPQRRAQAPKSQQPAPVQQVFDRYSGVVNEHEVRRASKTRKQQQIPQRLSVEEEAASHAIRDEWEFDLRDAVIKAAILERPYQ